MAQPLAEGQAIRHEHRESELITALLAAATHSPAQSCLKGLPQSLRSAVEQDGWTIVQPHDLPQPDLEIWNNTHLGECPGVAVGNPSPKAKPYFIVALIQQDGPKNFIEKVLLITMKQNQPMRQSQVVADKQSPPLIKVAVPETTVSTPHVVWLQRDDYLGIDPAPSRDSFVFEKLAGPASQPIIQGSHIKSFVASN
jgi:hypothetical protein